MHCIAGGITKNIQINDTNLNAPLKTKQRKTQQKSRLIKTKLLPYWLKPWSTSKSTTHLKRLSLTNSFDCTKDVAVSDRLMEAVGKSLLGKQKQIMKDPILKPIQRLTKTTAPLKDVHLIILKKVNHFQAKVKRC